MVSDTEHGERTTKDHFTVELSEHALMCLIFDNEVSVETDDFVARLRPPDEIDDQTLKEMAERFIWRL